MSRRFNRRRFLRHGTVWGFAGIAGCTGSSVGESRTSPTDTGSVKSAVNGGSDDELIFVHPDGTDRNDGTEDAPMGSIQGAIDRAHPGDTVVVGSGQYFESPETVRPGSASAPITITGPPDAIVSGRAGEGYAKGFGMGHSHVHLTGLTFDGLQDPSNPDDPEAYMNVAINVLPHTQEYLTDLVIKPHGIGNVQWAMIKVNFVQNVEIGEFEVIGPAGLGYLLRDRGGDFGEIVYIGSWAGTEFGDLDRTGELAGDDTSNDIHIHHIDNSAGYHHAELVDAKLGTYDVTIEYCTSAGGGQVGGYGRTIALQSYDVTLRWCDLRDGRGHGVDIGLDEVVRRQEEQEETEWTAATRYGGTGNRIYGNRVTGFVAKAFYFPFEEEGQGPDDQELFCGNDYDGETDGVPDDPCPESTPAREGIGHLGGDSPWA